MRQRAAISLFPFLSVLICTMGVLSFLAVTFLMNSSSSPSAGGPPAREATVEVNWVGAPPHVRPLLVECRSDGAMFHGGADQPPKFFSRRALAREAALVRGLREEGLTRMGGLAGEPGLWIFFKSAVETERRLDGSLTAALNRVELSNLSGDSRRRREEQYPILLVYPDGVETFDAVSFLVETTTRLATGVEPMLPGWSPPYRRGPS
jgi:hypothetical protein